MDYFGTTLTPTAYAGAYNIRFDKAGAGGSNNEAGDLRWTSMLVDYNVSKRSDVYAVLDYADYKGVKFTNAGQFYINNTVMAIGIRHKF